LVFASITYGETVRHSRPTIASAAATRIEFAAKLRRSYASNSYPSNKYSDGVPQHRAQKLDRKRHSFQYLISPNHIAGLEAVSDPGIDAYFTLCVSKDYDTAEELARKAVEIDPASRFARSALAEIYAYRSRLEEAARQIEAVRRYHPQNKWYRLTHADLLTDGKNLDEASAILKESQMVPGLGRHIYKRLSRIAYRSGNLPAALYWQERLVSLAPNYLVYASDYVFLAWLQVRVIDDTEAAIRTLEAGSEIYKRSGRIRKITESLRQGEWPDEDPWVSWPGADSPASDTKPELKEPITTDRFPGVFRIPISTPLVTMHSDLTALVDAATSSIREASDIVAISESVLSISQGRAIPLELVDPGPLARLLCRFVQSEGPLHSPEGMQGAVAEAGAARILAAAFGGGLGKLLGRSGLFYKIAGPRTAMIDDVAACMPPFDHHLILGPAAADEFCEKAASVLDCRVCVVDANNKTGAWLVGASSGTDRAIVESVLSDNPAGNEDEQTPIVLLKGLS
jgi:tetratricopeptide (TPR) repeat protein